MPYRAHPPAWICDDCGTDASMVSIASDHHPVFPWRGDGKVRCVRCSGNNAFYMLNQAERRIVALTREVERLRATRWYRRAWRWLVGASTDSTAPPEKTTAGH